jgi:hypothetical protein
VGAGAAGGRLVGLTAGVAVATLVVLSASAARAQEAPLMVQTVPSLQGVELSMFGTAVTTDDHGLAVATGAPGTYELTAPVSVTQGDVRWEFSGWSDGIDSPTRPVTVSSFTFLEAGYDVYHRARLALVAAGGEEFPEPLDSVTLIDDRGRRVTLSGGEPVWLLAQRAVETPSGLAPKEVGYRVHSISAGGRRVLPGGEQRLRPVPGRLIEIEAAPGEAAGGPRGLPEADRPTPPSSPLEDRPVWPFVVLGAAALALLALAGHSLGAGRARVGRSALARAVPHLGRKLSPVASETAAVARHAATGAVSVLRRSARGAVRLGRGVAAAGRSLARRSASLPSFLAGAADAGARSCLRLIATATRRAAATALAVRLGAAARASVHALATGLRRVRVSARVRAIATGGPRVGARGSRSRRAGSLRPETESAAAAPSESELVRVTLLDGRVIEGWWERQAAETSDFFRLTHVTKVLEPDGTDTVSSPVDAFIPVAKIADIERVEAPAREELQSLPRAAGAGRPRPVREDDAAEWAPPSSVVRSAPGREPAPWATRAGRGDRLAVGAVALAIVSMPLLQPKWPGHSAPADLLVALAAAAAVLWVSGKSLRIHFPYVIAMSVLMAAGIMAAVVSVAPFVGVLAVMQEVLLLAWCAAVANVCRNPTSLGVVLRSWCWSAIAYGSVLCFGRLSGMLWLAGIDPTVGSRAGLTFDHPNMAGNYFLISFFVVLLARHPRNPLLRAAALAVLLLAIAFTGSNAALIGLVLGSAVAGFLSVWRRTDLVGAVAAVAAAVVLGAIFTYFANNYDLADKAEASANSILRASVGRGAKSALGRKELFTDALLLYRTGSLLGRGPSSTDLSLQASQSGLIHEAHNDYLATLVERGPLGMVGLLLLVGGIYVRAMSISLRPLRPAFTKVVPGTAPLLGALVAFAASAMVHEILHYRHFWALMGVVAALYYFGRPDKPSSARGVAALTPNAASSGGELPWRWVEGRRGSTWSGVASPHAGSGGER